ncbi:FecR family protein [Rhizobium sp. CSW-27]|uniref:FecR family protein n=1 Tax=Rhizobium sp. CSW-27 TaxID=2839985 RepID=UPI001C01694B|nr:FecR family protein [Rhizobium sp. CSW-27]MBT9368968.1 FecR family protein [Rhizobium sp. CSW-27]
MTVNSDGKIELPPQILEEAADWLLQLQETPQDDRLRADFEAWLAASGRNRLAWQRTQRAWQAFGGTEPQYREHWENGPRSGAGVASATRPMPRRSAWRSRGMLAAITGAALCLFAVFLPSVLILLRADYRTATAESRTVTLADGSTVQLAASSAIATDFSGNRRRVVLLEGQAFFDVVPDQQRPFVVDANSVTVQVLGTAFDVEISDRLTSVALEHGSVRASVDSASAAPPETLVPGEMLLVDTSTGAMRKQSIALEDIGSWRTGRLYVVNQTIGSVIEQIQRYHPAWITIPDPVLARQTVTGFYDLRAPDRALEALVEPYGGKVHTVSNLARIIARF